jgi:uncharacterized protein involved in type VI secretion and phage assembly
MSSNPTKYYGKYRGEVTDNQDPLTLGRIRAKVPAIFGGNDSGWATPCAPYAGKGVGFFFIPPVGAKVWIEFEGGDPENPIWSGGFWETGDTPKTPASPDVKVIKTDSATITLDDTAGAGSLTIETTSGLKIVMDSTGIELSNSSSKVKLTSSSVSINDGALEVV